MLHPSLEKFKTPPVVLSGYTIVTCIHPTFGTVTFYFGIEEFQDNIKVLLSPCWVNGITVLIQPAD